MRVTSYQSVLNNMGSKTKTVKDYGSFLGKGPHRLGITTSLFKKNTSAYLLDKLGNNTKLKPNPNKPMSLRSITATVYDWGIEMNTPKTVRIVEQATDDGVGQRPISIIVEEPYFFENDTMVVDGSRDQLFVLAPGTNEGPNRWRYSVQLVTDDPSNGVNLAFLNPTNTVRFNSNYYSELSENRHSRFQSNIEVQKQHLSLHGTSCKKSGQYALEEYRYYQMYSGKGKKPTYYRMHPDEYKGYQEFFQVRNRHLLTGRSNFHFQTGECMIKQNGFDVPIGDGILTQFEKFGERFAYSTLTDNTVRDIISDMRKKSDELSGNQYVIVCNEDFQADFEAAMLEYLQQNQLPATALYSKSKDAYVKVGSDFTSYKYLGNQVTIIPDRHMSIEFSDRAYGVCIDVTPNMGERKAAIETFTLEGADMITGTLAGLGGEDGKTSGVVSSLIHGVAFDIIGYSGAAVYNPYRSFIIESNISSILM